MKTEQLANRVARHMWRKDGEPEFKPGEPTSVGRPWYESRAKEVVAALAEMGYVVVKAPKGSSRNKPRAPRAAQGASA